MAVLLGISKFTTAPKRFKTHDGIHGSRGLVACRAIRDRLRGDYHLDSSELDRNIEIRLQEADQLGVPLFIGEYGGMANVANFNEYIDDGFQAFDRYLAGSTYWLYAMGDGFHMLDSDGQERDFVDIFVRPYARTVPGLVLSTSFDLENRHLQLTIVGDTTVSEPGDIFVPTRHYPNGFELTGCDQPGCLWEHEPEHQRVVFWINDEGQHDLSITPVE